MLIKVLVENTSSSGTYGCEHGLSLYIETQKHKLLFDVGAGDLFFENAEKMGVLISEIDFLVISHGHYDHGGGLHKFLEENTKAKILMRREAFEKHCARKKTGEIYDIGIDENLKSHPRIVLTSNRYAIDEDLWLLSDVVQKNPQQPSGLLAEYAGQLAEDRFDHEQNLVIEEKGMTLLITGCAHNGIVNILETYGKLKGTMPNYVIGGFHLSHLTDTKEDHEAVDTIASYLLGTKTKYYTGHCTGLEPYKRLKAQMGDQIDYISTGREIIL